MRKAEQLSSFIYFRTDELSAPTGKAAELSDLAFSKTTERYNVSDLYVRVRSQALYIVEADPPSR